jgi:hypothetical protein
MTIITGYLDMVTLIKLSKVCRSWYKMITCSEFWNDKAHVYYMYIVFTDKKLKYEVQIDYLYVRLIKKWMKNYTMITLSNSKYQFIANETTKFRESLAKEIDAYDDYMESLIPDDPCDCCRSIHCRCVY